MGQLMPFGFFDAFIQKHGKNRGDAFHHGSREILLLDCGYICSLSCYSDGGSDCIGAVMREADKKPLRLLTTRTRRPEDVRSRPRFNRLRMLRVQYEKPEHGLIALESLDRSYHRVQEGAVKGKFIADKVLNDNQENQP